MEMAEMAAAHLVGSLENCLVSIVNQPPIDPTRESLEGDPNEQPIQVDGKKGCAVAWIPEEGKYVVQTFDGDVVGVAGDHLIEYMPEPPEESHEGFDVAFPASNGKFEDFASAFVDTMLAKQYCVVQMYSRPEDRSSFPTAVAEASQNPETSWMRMMPEFERVYLGRVTTGKKALWTDLASESKQLDALVLADQALSNLGLLVMPACPALGFIGYTKSNCLIHAGASPEDEEALMRDLHTQGRVVDGKEIQDHLTFRDRQKLCMMYFVLGTAGKLILHDRRGKEGEPDVTILCQENQVVIFRHDLLDYTYIPKDGEWAVQTWIMREPHAGESEMTPRADLQSLANIPEGPQYPNSNETVDVMSLSVRIPGLVWEPDAYWSMLSCGTDAIILVPINRWDLDMYYSEEQFPGKGYIRHFGMIDNQQMAGFDNEFFGITEEEALRIDPTQRLCCEVGYDCLQRAGWSREKLRGIELVVSYGYTDTEFGAMALRWQLGPISKSMKQNLMMTACCSRLHYLFGMTGPCSTTETACSSSLSATALMHTWLRPVLPDTTSPASLRKQYRYGLAGGSNGHFDPFYTIALCGAGMLTHVGRCFTFDQSADGFVRGEGTAAMHYKVSDEYDLARLAMLCGSCMNQDGRSASLTAPHGPSQQECIRHSLREASILPLDIQIQELHGTGTALGDPIEVGALRATMMAHSGAVREHPLVKTSSKSNIGHTEMCAGINGIMKCVLMGLYCCSAPNIHLRLLNPHIDSAAYPVYFSSEFVDQGKDEGYHGVSSFGFGGSNARGDIWARAQAGPRNTQPGNADMDFSNGRIYAFAELYGSPSVPKAGVPAAQTVEDVGVFTGDFLVGNAIEPQNTFYVEGTFNFWSSMEKMYWLEDKQAWTFALTLGETLVEQFKIVCNMYEDAKVFPACKMAGMDALVLGPGPAPKTHNWVIDGRTDGARKGTTYMIFFRWDAEARQKRVTWEECVDEVVLSLAATTRVQHNYCIVGSWTNFTPAAMEAAGPGENSGLYRASVRIGLLGHEEFHFRRDGDPVQIIYPAQKRALRPTVPIRGPDLRGEAKYWTLRGNTGDKFSIELRILNGVISMSTVSPQQGTNVYRSMEPEHRSYFVSGQWDNWACHQMIPHRSKPFIFQSKMVMTSEGFEQFQILVDEDATQAIYPEMPLANQMVSWACGPDSKGVGLYWGINASPGETVQITLDLSQKDKRDIVTWEVMERPRE